MERGGQERARRVGVVGTGMVGSSFAYALMQRSLHDPAGQEHGGKRDLGGHPQTPGLTAFSKERLRPYRVSIVGEVVY